jgi:hypothetical protein
MKTKLLAVGLAIVTGYAVAPARSCVVVPIGDCTNQFLQALSQETSQKQTALRDLAKKVKQDRKLYVAEAEQLMRYQNARTNIELIKDPVRRAAAEKTTPVGIARVVDGERSGISDKDWEHLIKLWSRYLHETADSLDGYNPGKFCDAKKEGKSLAQDAETAGAPLAAIVILPVYMAKDLVKHGKLSDDYNAPSIPLVALAPAVGAMTVAADIVTFVPSQIAKHAAHLKEEIHLRRSAAAFGEFAQVAVSLDKKNDPNGGTPLKKT